MTTPDGIEANDNIPVVPMPVDVRDDRAFPEFDAARRHLHSLPPERRARIEREAG